MDDDQRRAQPAVGIGWLAVDAVDPARLASWWGELLGAEVSPDGDGDVRLLSGPVPLLFMAVPEPKGSAKNRLHLDLRCNDFEGAQQRALELGAVPADDVHVTERWRVLRDPEGNEFCIIRP